MIGRWLGGAVRGLGCLVLLLVGLKFAWHSMFRALWSPPAEPRYYALFTDEGGSVEVLLYPDRRAVIRAVSETSFCTETVFARLGGTLEEHWLGRLWRRDSFFWFTGWAWAEEGSELARLHTTVLARTDSGVQDPGLGEVGETRTHPWTIHENWLRVDELWFVRLDLEPIEFLEVREELEALADPRDRTSWCARARSK